MSQVLSSIEYMYFRKTSGSNTGAPNLLLARASSSLVTPLGAVGLSTNHKPTLPSHRSLISINFTKGMLHENVKFHFKFIYLVEAHYVTLQIFSVFVESLGNKFLVLFFLFLFFGVS